MKKIYVLLLLPFVLLLADYDLKDNLLKIRNTIVTPVVPAVPAVPPVVHGKSYLPTNAVVTVAATIYTHTGTKLANTTVRFVSKEDGWTYTGKTDTKGYFEFGVQDRGEFIVECWDVSIKNWAPSVNRYNINIYNNLFIYTTEWLWIKDKNYGIYKK